MQNLSSRPTNPASEILTVSQLNQRARQLLEDVFPRIWVEGEISNLARPASGHLYFTLKDAQAQVRCAFFRQNAARTRQIIENGTLVKVAARVSLYEGRGDYQLIVEQLEAAGEGALRAAFEALKQQLLAEGLFDQQRKKDLPKYPRRIAVVTSPTGAVWQDILSVFARRAPQVALTQVPTAVQGKEATAQIVQALKLADRGQFDAIILARGGGSLEDLWCFNEEIVARTIADSITPIVSAIGHETDISISDFVADVRAPTPTAAAELLAPERQALLQRIDYLQQRLQRRLSDRLKTLNQQLHGLNARIRHPKQRIEQSMQRLDELELRLTRACTQLLQSNQQQVQLWHNRLQIQHPQTLLNQQQQRLTHYQQALTKNMTTRLSTEQYKLQSVAQTLHLVSPLATLDRGYSILRDENQQVIRSNQQVRSGQQLQAHLAEGQLRIQVL
ncbi:MAG: exodeoxyribonuclease VII large subunit [Thiopseudomonas sp.]|nr:exodeoxyribonuclease VII large subunit [Thiopseudomonas sp.]MCK9465380.1 exodeoxyribonuclease VII large subunit [Thiopseudomonas sp.]